MSEEPRRRPKARSGPSRPVPQPIGRVLEEMVTSRRWARRLEGARIFDAWDEIAGPEIASHATPVRLHGGVLVVAAADAAWATQLRYLTADLLTRANEILGEGAVRSVHVVVQSAGGGPEGL